MLYFPWLVIRNPNTALTGGSELYPGLYTFLQSINRLNWRTKQTQSLSDKFLSTQLLVKLDLRTPITHSGKAEMIPVLKCWPTIHSPAFTKCLNARIRIKSSMCCLNCWAPESSTSCHVQKHEQGTGYSLELTELLASMHMHLTFG